MTSKGSDVFRLFDKNAIRVQDKRCAIGDRDGDFFIAPRNAVHDAHKNADNHQHHD